VNASASLVVIGRSGQLARALGAAAGDATLCGREAFDLATDDPARLLDQTEPAAVINAAAYTDVNGAEADAAAAHALNCDGPARLARACQTAGVRFIHVSTDYVFDGAGGAPYTEDAPTRPLNIYGRTKRDGEAAILNAAPDATIIRAAWIFDERGGSFLNAILKRLEAGQALKVVDDQISAPTWAPDLAETLLKLARQTAPVTGLFHYCGGDYASWYDFAVAAADAASQALPAPAVIEPVGSDAFPQPAERPKDTRLNAGALLKRAGIGQGDWRAGLDAVIQQRLARTL
jgi:dTDP-4-dehydrorhamnose reductase